MSKLTRKIFGWMVLHALLLLALSACTTTPPTRFADYDPTAEPPWKNKEFSGSAWLIKPETYHTHGHTPWYAFPSIANTGPSKTDVILRGTIIATIAGPDRTGERIAYRERWNTTSYHPYGTNHPAKFYQDRTPLIVVTGEHQNLVSLYPVTRLEPHLQKLAWNEVLADLVTQETANGYFAGFLFAKESGKTLDGVEYTREEMPAQIRSAAAQGYAFSITDHNGFVAIYPVDPAMKSGLSPGNGMDQALQAVERYFSSPSAKPSVFIAHPVRAYDRPAAEARISTLVETQKPISLSTFGFLGKTWIVITGHPITP